MNFKEFILIEATGISPYLQQELVNIINKVRDNNDLSYEDAIDAVHEIKDFFEQQRSSKSGIGFSGILGELPEYKKPVDIFNKTYPSILRNLQSQDQTVAQKAKEEFKQVFDVFIKPAGLEKPVRYYANQTQSGTQQYNKEGQIVDPTKKFADTVLKLKEYLKPNKDINSKLKILFSAFNIDTKLN